MKFLVVLMFSVLSYALSPRSALALDIQFQQILQQGALVTGHTNAGQIELLGRKVKVDSNGLFVFGIGRDIGAALELTLIGRSGQKETIVENVQQRQYVTQSIEGVASKYVSPPADVSRRISSDSAQIKAARAINTEARADFLANFIWPAEGPVSGVYGSQRIFNGVPKRPHYGLDIAAPKGTPVIAPIAGKVSLAHNDMYYSGGTLIIDHGRGVSSTFIHLSKLHVAVGDEVKQGQLIGEVGASGRATGPHLDWRINWFEQRLDPQLLVPPRD